MVKTLSVVSTLLLLIASGCHKSEEPNFKCHEGTIIGSIRSWGGGVAISLNDSDLSTHQWRGHKNVVEALNVPDTLWRAGQTVFLLARPATEKERNFAISADGDESAKPIIYVMIISTLKCPTIHEN